MADLTVDKRQRLLVAIEEISVRHPNDTRLKFSKAILLQQEGKNAESLQLAEAILTREEDVNAVILKITSLEALERSEEAEAFLISKVESLPKNLRLRLALARMLFEKGRLDEAHMQYEHILALSPNDGDVLFALALIAMQKEDDAQARRYLEKMVRWNKRAIEANYYLGSLAERRADPKAALSIIARLALDEFVPAQARVSAILVEDGFWEEARENLQRARTTTWKSSTTGYG